MFRAQPPKPFVRVPTARAARRPNLVAYIIELPFAVRRLGAQLASRVAVAQVHSGSGIQPFERMPSASHARRAFAITPPPQGTRPPRRAPCSRMNTIHGLTLRHAKGQHTIETGNRPSPLSCSRWHRASPRRRERFRHCLAAKSPGSRPILLAALSQTGAFEAPRDHAGHRASPRLRQSFPS